MRLLIIGPQGAGKGTQATLLTEQLGIPHISTGDLFRANISGGTELGRRVQSILDSGALVPDEITQDMLIDRLSQPDTEAGFLLDGFPRNLAQARWLQHQLDARQTPIQAVIVLEAPDEALVERMLARGRADDTVEAISARLAIYHNETSPLVDFYADKVVRIDGVGEVAQVADRIRKALDGLEEG